MKILHSFLLFLSISLISATIRRVSNSGRRMTAQRRRFLNRNMHMDMEKRRDRLQELNIGCKKLIEPNMDEMKRKISEIGPIEIQKPYENETLDLFHLNEEEGTADYFFQGDMHLTDEQLALIEEDMKEEESSQKRVKRQASTIARKWADNTLFYYFDSSISERVRASVAAALSEIRAKTCINFVESSTATNRVKVFSGPGCFATVGMNGGEQQLSLGRGCEVVGTAAHEFAHALGIFHTQMRSDRDDFVTINTASISPGLLSNFAKLSPRQSVSYTQYEYGSMMHYPADAFANAGEIAIVAKDSRFTRTMGNRMITFFDLLTINDHYGCSARCSAATSARCRNGGVPNPRNCAACNCPSGYSGPLCDQRPPGCGETLSASGDWQSKTFSYGDPNSREVRDVFSFCNHWITAPQGRQIQVRITNMFNSQCNFGCAFNGIEIKVNRNQQETNPRVCCETSLNQIMSSQVNPTPMVSFNRFFTTTFTIQYRHVAGNSGGNEVPGGQQPAATTRRPIRPRRIRPFGIRRSQSET